MFLHAAYKAGIAADRAIDKKAKNAPAKAADAEAALAVAMAYKTDLAEANVAANRALWAAKHNRNRDRRRPSKKENTGSQSTAAMERLSTSVTSALTEMPNAFATESEALHAVALASPLAPPPNLRTNITAERRRQRRQQTQPANPKGEHTVSRDLRVTVTDAQNRRLTAVPDRPQAENAAARAEALLQPGVRPSGIEALVLYHAPSGEHTASRDLRAIGTDAQNRQLTAAPARPQAESVAAHAEAQHQLGAQPSGTEALDLHHTHSGEHTASSDLRASGPVVRNRRFTAAPARPQGESAAARAEAQHQPGVRPTGFEAFDIHLAPSEEHTASRDLRATVADAQIRRRTAAPARPQANTPARTPVQDNGQSPLLAGAPQLQPDLRTARAEVQRQAVRLPGPEMELQHARMNLAEAHRALVEVRRHAGSELTANMRRRLAERHAVGVSHARSPMHDIGHSTLQDWPQDQGPHDAAVLTPNEAAGSHHVRSMSELGTDSRNACGDTPLICAARNGHTHVVRRILEAIGAAYPPRSAIDNILVCNNAGESALSVAASGGHLGVVEALLASRRFPSHEGGEEVSPPRRP